MLRSTVLAAVLPLVVLSAGCESQATVAADMERALRDSNTALLGALLSAEIMDHLLDTPDTTLLRHNPSACGCPCLAQQGTNPPYILELYYVTSGCIPDTGLLPTAMAGHVYCDWDGTTCHEATFDPDFLFALEHPVSGTFGGSLAGNTADLVVKPTGDLTVEDTTIEVGDLRIELGPDDVRVDGTSAVTPPPRDQDERNVEFDGVVMPWDSIGAPCPRPTDGTATLVNADAPKKNAVVRFSKPGQGYVTVERDGQISEPTDFCAYASDLW